MINVDVEALLRELKIPVRDRGRKEIRARCPNPKHHHDPDPKAVGSWSIRTIGERAGRHHCLVPSCNFGGGPIGLVATVLGIDRPAARRWLVERFGLELKTAAVAAPFHGKVQPAPVLRYPDKTQALWLDLSAEVRPALAYVLRRGMTHRDVERYRVGAVPAHVPAYGGRVIVPVVVGGTMVDFVARLFVDRSGVPKALSGRVDLGARKELALWGIDDVPPELGWVVVVEGLWGAIAVRNAFGADVAVAACGSSWSEERTDLLERFERVVVVHDGDPAGRAFGAKLAQVFGRRASIVDPGDGLQPDTHPDLRALVMTGLQAAPSGVQTAAGRMG